MKRPHWLESIHHDSSSCYVDFAHKRIGAKVRLKLRASLDAPIEQIYVRLCPDGEQSMIPMHYLSSDEVCQWWQTEIELSMPLVGYRFFLITKEGSWHLNAAGITRYTPTDSSDFKLITCQSSNTPDWIHECVFYQIFPDRFADSQRIDNVKNGEYSYSGKPVISRSWGELPNKLTGGREFFGGDLYGIIERLDYLQELGINAIYLNPIFTAPSNHKYDTQDYFQVDPYLGKEEALIALRIALDKRKMRLMLDIVLNHCGATNQWFTDAQQDSSSETADFFTFYEHPNNYACWLGISTLPKLNYRSEKLRELIYSGQHSVLRYWLRPPYRIDGWRIDVANMLARQGESQLGHKIG
ncbi:MAG: maltodextrin glucosidase, partial [Blastocatellia bacterium]|nr:maltodextrin glucosidase [Blastocatellia bacterium]